MENEKRQLILNLGQWSVGRIVVVFILGFILIANLELEKHKLLYIILGMALILEAFQITQNNLPTVEGKTLPDGMRYALLLIMTLLSVSLILLAFWIAYIVCNDISFSYWDCFGFLC